MCDMWKSCLVFSGQITVNEMPLCLEGLTILSPKEDLLFISFDFIINKLYFLVNNADVVIILS